jgi:hypothetical protein
MNHEMKVSRIERPFEVYCFSDRWDGGTALLREWTRTAPNGRVDHCGEILFHTSYGSYAYTWSSMATRLKHFLAEAGRRGECGYIMGKFAGSELTEPDREATANEFRKGVIERRREKRLTKDQAREDWTMIANYECDTIERLVDAVSDTHTFDANCYEHVCTRMKPAHKHFWENIFLPLCKCLERELRPVEEAAA